MKDKIFNKTKLFLESKIFIIILLIMAFFCYVFKLYALCRIIVPLVIIVLLIFKCQFVTIVPILFIHLLTKGEPHNFKILSFSMITSIILFVIMAILLLINLIKNFKLYVNTLKLNLVFIAMIVTIIIMLLSVINSPIKGDAFHAIGNYLIGLLFFLLALFYIDNNEENKKKILFSIICFGFYIATQCFFKGIDLHKEGLTFNQIITYEDALRIGWIHPNHCAALINICLFASIYYFLNIKDIKNRIFSVIGIITFISLQIIILSRAGLLALMICLILIVVYYIKRIKNNENRIKEDYPYLISIGALFIIGFIILLSLGTVEDLFDVIKRLGFVSSARKEVYKIGLRHFKKHWLIGNGVYSSSYYIRLENPQDPVSNYHNYYIQALSCTGILGAFAFTFYLVAILLELKKSPNDNFKYFVIFVIIYMLLHGLLDTIFFNFRIEPLMLILLALVYKCKTSTDKIET